ncbi:DNA-binding beta-propeller fold protein YncE [Catalinimonas alkaloidigena]|uniref:YncE family protein n=1 Tax=Catalinimonas alkaloidigena TaxID=1075417 RepID=UPI002404B8A6|nr:YncE family protein [Catalinimonas alkaloidigena]MDF9796100.1 DNA-binding beta-propeller fold protein YncE [Catalinimonas alkaloidigena]
MKKICISAAIILICLHTLQAQDYYVYVAAESEDEVALIKFDGEKAETIKRIPVGVWPAEIEGPHGMTVAPDGKHWYLSMAHGNPFGYLYKFETGSDEKVGETTLGLFPASMQISPANGLLFVVNFNLHGDMVPSTISVVDPETMSELKQVTVGTMPHGSRITPDGMHQYSVGMMSGELFEINTMTLEVSRILKLDTNEAIDPEMEDAHAIHEGHNMSDNNTMATMSDMAAMEHQHSPTKPTWVMPHPTKPLAYVAGNGSDEILEVDLDAWKIVDRFKGGKGPYNLDITPDGSKLVVSYKSDGSTGVWDLRKKKEIARIENLRKVTHGVAMSPDSRYAFVSVEGIGGEPGTMEVIDLKKGRRVAYAELGKQAGGIAFWKMEN